MRGIQSRGGRGRSEPRPPPPGRGLPPGLSDPLICSSVGCQSAPCEDGWWIPELPKNRVDRAVFDEDSQFLRRFLEGLPAELTPGGEGLLILSGLAVPLGLRPPGWLEEQFVRCGLTVA